MTDTSFIRKYNVPAPRYTSYPTVPYWDQSEFHIGMWMSEVKRAFDASNASDGISLYIHLPYCESLCTYCGCNMRVTVNHGVEEPYIRAVLAEWAMYRSFLGRPKIREIHLGGGTPTFFSPANLERLIGGILENADIHPHYGFGIEAHPNNTRQEHLVTLSKAGFRRISFGIQDFDPGVQEIIHRFQSEEQVEHVTKLARQTGFTSVNYDLVYGLPRQTPGSLIPTIEKVLELRPDRIAFYSYAHVPWMRPGQRRFTESDVPTGEEKLKLYETGRRMFEEAGYVDIGMDHFALPGDSLSDAARQHSLHRNFMGYTTQSTKLLVGLGVSAIGDCWSAFGQNVKVVEEYLSIVKSGHLPLYRGHFLTEEDNIMRRHILNIMCSMKTSWDDERMQCPGVQDAIKRLVPLVNDGLVELSTGSMAVTQSGKSFLRNICMAFDARLWKQQPESALFSMAV